MKKINWTQIISLGIPYLIETVKELRKKRKNKGKYTLYLSEVQLELLQKELPYESTHVENIEDEVEYRKLIHTILTLN